MIEQQAASGSAQQQKLVIDAQREMQAADDGLALLLRAIRGGLEAQAPEPEVIDAPYRALPEGPSA